MEDFLDNRIVTYNSNDSLFKCNCCNFISNTKENLCDHLNSIKHRVNNGKLAIILKNIERHMKKPEDFATFAFHSIKHLEEIYQMHLCDFYMPHKFENLSFSILKHIFRKIIEHVIKVSVLDFCQNRLQNVVFVGISTNIDHNSGIHSCIVQYFHPNDGIVEMLLDFIDDFNIIEILTRYNLLSKVTCFCGDFKLMIRGKDNVNSNHFQILQQNAENDISNLPCAECVIHNALQKALNMVPYNLETLHRKIKCFLEDIDRRDIPVFIFFMQKHHTCLISRGTYYAEIILEKYDIIKDLIVQNTEAAPKILINFFEDSMTKFYLHLVDDARKHLQKNNIVCRNRKLAVDYLKQMKNIHMATTVLAETAYISKSTSTYITTLSKSLKNYTIKFCYEFYNCIAKHIEYYLKFYDNLKPFQWVCLDKHKSLSDDIHNSYHHLLKLMKKTIDCQSCNKLYQEIKILLDILRIGQINFRKTEEKWLNIFKYAKPLDIPLLAQLVQFALSFPGSYCNSDTEEMLSKIPQEWKKDEIKNNLIVLVNSKKITCLDFYHRIKEEPVLLNVVNEIVTANGDRERNFCFD